MNRIRNRFERNVSSLAGNQDNKSQSGIAQLGYVVRGKYMIVDDEDSRYMFARFADGGFVRARHEGQVVPEPDKYVRVVTVENITYLKPLTKEEEYYYGGGSSTTAQVGIHSHKRGTSYEFEIDPYLLGNGRTTLYADLSVKTTQSWFWDNGSFDGTTEIITDLSSNLPSTANTWFYTTLSIDPATNTIEVEEGSEKSLSLPLLMSDIPVPDPENICLCAIKLRYGQTDIYPADIIDLRGSLISQAIATVQIADMVGATSIADGASGLVTKPVAGEQDDALLGDGTFAFRHMTSTASSTVTISSGAATVGAKVSFLVLAAQSGVTDDLDTLTITGNPRLIVIQADAGDTITVKHSTGNIELNGAADYAVTGDKTLLLFWDGSNISDVGIGGGGGGSFATLSDVDVSTPPSDTQVPMWDNVAGKWKPGDSSLTDVDYGGMDLIASSVVAVAAASVTITVPQTHKHLIVVSKFKSTRTDDTDTSMKIQYNGDTGNNYSYLSDLRRVTSPSILEVATAAYIAVPVVGSQASPVNQANFFSNGHMRIADYAGADYKLMDSTSDWFRSTTSFSMWRISGIWKSTAAISSITFSMVVGNVAAGSEFYVYGVSAEIGGVNAALSSGWVPTSETWTYAGADAPSFTLTISGDQTAKYTPGMRVRLAQATGGTKYFIITGAAYGSPNTTLTLYGGTDYTLVSETITNPHYSTAKAPAGFPLDPAKWTVTVTDTSLRSQASPAAGTWYNLGSISISIPIGIWDVEYNGAAYCAHSSNGYASIFTTLSTANNSQSDSTMTCYSNIYTATMNLLMMYRRRFLTLAAKTSYYINAKTSDTTGGLTIAFANDDVPLIIRATSAYL